MTSVERLLEPFAASIYAKAGAIKLLDLTRMQKARLLESISDDIKKCTNFIPPEVSGAALAESARMGVNLRSMCWHDQPQFDKGRRVFPFEHVVPVSAVRSECLNQTTTEGVRDVLKSMPRVAWILKSEDTTLTRLGYRSRRRDPAMR